MRAPPLALFAACQNHARRCGRCFVPIMDEEGNPGYLSEACAEGYPLLEALIDAERGE